MVRGKDVKSLNIPRDPRRAEVVFGKGEGL
jgi:hypothetical protein